MNNYERHLFLLLLGKKESVAINFLEINVSNIDVNKTISVMPENIANENVVYSNDILLQNTSSSSLLISDKKENEVMNLPEISLVIENINANDFLLQNAWLRKYNDYSFLAIASMNGLIGFVTNLVYVHNVRFPVEQTNLVNDIFTLKLINKIHPAYLAYQNKQIDVLRFFVNKEIYFSKIIEADKFQIAIINGDFRLLTCHFENPYSFNPKLNCFGDNMLHVAVLFNCYDMTAYILQKLPTIINEQNNEGNTPLHLACLLNDRRMIDLLLSVSKCKVNFCNNKNLKPIDMLPDQCDQNIIELLRPKMDATDLVRPNKLGVSPVKKLSNNQNTLSSANFFISSLNQQSIEQNVSSRPVSKRRIQRVGTTIRFAEKQS